MDALPPSFLRELGDKTRAVVGAVFVVGVLCAVADVGMSRYQRWQCSAKLAEFKEHMAAIDAEHKAARVAGYSEAGRASIREHMLALQAIEPCKKP